jgi:hypothetical protein
MAGPGFGIGLERLRWGMNFGQIAAAYPEAMRVPPTTSEYSTLIYNMILGPIRSMNVTYDAFFGVFKSGLEYIEISGRLRTESEEITLEKHLNAIYGPGSSDMSDDKKTIAWDPATRLYRSIIHYESWHESRSIVFEMRIMDSLFVTHIDQ